MPMDNLTSRCLRIRKTILEMSMRAKSAHVGSSLSCVEILAALFLNRGSDSYLSDCKIVLSKGHAAMALYATAIEFGLLSADVVANYLQNGSQLWGHPSVSDNMPFIHWSTGSLGHGLPAVCGMAYAAQKMLHTKQKFFVVLSDGELDEGSNWEAILFAGHHGLSNIKVIVDYNKLQSFGRCEEVLDLEPFAEKWRAFGWRPLEIDGHNLQVLKDSLMAQDANPTVLIAHTTKGKGIASYEDKLESHYKPVTEEILVEFLQQESPR